MILPLIILILLIIPSHVHACPNKGVEKLPPHLVQPYCDCYHKIVLEPRWIIPGRERAELVCGGKAWDTAYKQSKGK
jgi:hypothetical protein